MSVLVGPTVWQNRLLAATSMPSASRMQHASGKKSQFRLPILLVLGNLSLHACPHFDNVKQTPPAPSLAINQRFPLVGAHQLPV